MANYIERIEIIGLHNRFDIDQKFKPGVNIIHAVNGAGKTTLIHCLVNILTGDYYRFLYIQFFRIRLWFDDNNLLTIYNDYDQNQEPSIRVCINSDRRGIKINERINEFDELNSENDESEETINNSYKEEKGELYKLDYTQTKVLLSTTYFPAFRIMIEAWKSVEENTTIDEITSLSRKIFGNFLPLLKYPTSHDVEQSLINEIQVITSEISDIDRQLMSQISVEYLAVTLEDKLNVSIDSYEFNMEEIETIFDEIKSFPIPENAYISSTEIYKNILDKIASNILNEENMKEFIKFLTIYCNSLKKLLLIINEKFYLFYKYLSAVNSFLQGKKIEILNVDTRENSPLVGIRFDDNYVVSNLSTLSSGERQIITMMYATTYMSQEKLILIDEPELSLHIDWQRILLKKISEQQSKVQIIACTHSPMLAADYPDNLKGLQLKFTDKNLWGLDDIVDENEITQSTYNTDEGFDDYDFTSEEKEIE